MLQKIQLALAGIVLIVLPAHAEEKNQLALMLGTIATPNLEIAGGKLEVGSGLAFQLNYARRLVSSSNLCLYFELPALAVPLQTIRASNGSLPANYDSFFVTPALRLQLAPSRRVSPWISAGAGYALFDESALRMDGSHNVSRGTSGGALEFGGGVDIRTPVRVLFPVSLRVEMRDLYTSKPNYNLDTGGGFQHNLLVSGGLVLHF